MTRKNTFFKYLIISSLFLPIAAFTATPSFAAITVETISDATDLGSANVYLESVDYFYYYENIWISGDGSTVTGTYYEDESGDEYGAMFKYDSSGGTVDLGDSYPSSTPYNNAADISDDGSIIVGSFYDSGYRGFVSTDGGALVDIGDVEDLRSGGSLSDTRTNAYAVSGDGTTIVGRSRNESSIYRAFSYDIGTNTMTDLTALSGGDGSSQAQAVSSDGSIVTGFSNVGSVNHAFKYTASDDTMVDLEDLGDGITDTTSLAEAISADGSVIVGYSKNASGVNRAFKHTDLGGMVDLEDLDGDDGTDLATGATGVSADGTTTIGYSNDGVATAQRAFKHTDLGGMVDLGDLNPSLNTQVWAYGVSADGDVVVGTSQNATGDNRAFIHTDTGGMVDIGDLGDGITKTDTVATAVSADGTVVTGYSVNADGHDRAFIVNVSYSEEAEVGSLVDIANTNLSLYGNGARLNSIINLNNSSLEFALDQDSTVFGENNISVSVGTRYTNVSGITAQESTANLKLAYRFNNHFRTGVYLDQTVAKSMPGQFDVRNPQPLVGVFAAYSQKADGTGFGARIAGAYNSSTLTITRDNSLSNTEAGQGRTKLITQGMMAEISYGIKVSEKFNVKPYVGVRRTSVERTGYTEDTGADFPIVYEDLTKESTTAFAGVKLSGYLTRKLGSSVSAGYEHDTMNAMDGYAGNVTNIGSFDLDAPSLRRNRAVASVGAFYDVEENQSVNMGVNYSQTSLNSGNSITVYASYNMGF